jgi:hypothetical protein
VKVGVGIEIASVVMPSAHAGTGRRDALALAKRLEERIFVQVQEQIVIVIESLAERFWSIAA